MHLQRVSKLIVIILLWGSASTGFSQELPGEIFLDSSAVMQQLFAFSADSMQGRSTKQQAGISKARNFIINSLVHSGVPAYVPDYTQSFDIPIQSKDTLVGVNILAYVEGYSSDEIIVT